MDAEGHRDARGAEPFQRAYADALLAGDVLGAEAVVREAMDAGLAETEIDDHVVGPALVLVGDLWADGRITIAEEHLATSISMRVLALQREAFRVARERVTQRVLLAGAEGEQHVVGLEMAASVILHAGYDVRLFGADLPIDELPAVIASHRPAVVGLSAATASTAGRLPEAFATIRRASPEVGILVGGRAVDHRLVAGWDVTVCRHVSEAVERVDALVKRARRN